MRLRPLWLRPLRLRLEALRGLCRLRWLLLVLGTLPPLLKGRRNPASSDDTIALVGSRLTRLGFLLWPGQKLHCRTLIPRPLFSNAIGLIDLRAVCSFACGRYTLKP